MVNIGFQERLAKAAAAVGRGALPVLASGLQSRIYSLPLIRLLQSWSHWLHWFNIVQWTLPAFVHLRPVQQLICACAQSVAPKQTVKIAPFRFGELSAGGGKDESLRPGGVWSLRIHRTVCC